MQYRQYPDVIQGVAVLINVAICYTGQIEDCGNPCFRNQLGQSRAENEPPSIEEMLLASYGSSISAIPKGGYSFSTLTLKFALFWLIIQV